MELRLRGSHLDTEHGVILGHSAASIPTQAWLFLGRVPAQISVRDGSGQRSRLLDREVPVGKRSSGL